MTVKVLAAQFGHSVRAASPTARFSTKGEGRASTRTADQQQPRFLANHIEPRTCRTRTIDQGKRSRANFIRRLRRRRPDEYQGWEDGTAWDPPPPTLSLQPLDSLFQFVQARFIHCVLPVASVGDSW